MPPGAGRCILPRAGEGGRKRGEIGLAESREQVLTLDPLELEIRPGDLAGLLRALAKHPGLFEEVEALSHRVRAALGSPSPAGWLAVMKALESLENLPGLEFPRLFSPLPSPGRARDLADSLEREVSRIQACRPLFGEFRRRMGGRNALVGRVLAGAADLLEMLLDEGAVRPRARLLATPAEFRPEEVRLPELGFSIPSRSLSRFFRAPALADEEEEFEEQEGRVGGEGPEGVVLFAATIGPGVEEKAREAFARGEPFAGTVLDALGSTLAEGAARAVGEAAGRLLGEGGPDRVVRRYHSGYGDWNLSGQADLFRALDPGRIGISLTETFLMVPEKSVAGLAAWKRRKTSG